jgi:serine/threonine protein kinase
MMPSPSPISDLLLRWEELRQRGETVEAEQLCAGHPDWLAELKLQIQALEEMSAVVTAYPNCTAVSSPGHEEAADFSGPDTDLLAPPQEPDEIGRLGGYRVLKVLDAGGMGVVFQAEDPQLRRLVALKVMRRARADSDLSRKRFLREARAAAALEHDHIVRVYQVGEDRGLPFLVMELLQGEALDVRLKREGPLPLVEILRIGREVCAGLAAAHDRDLIHRDIKPSNLWLEAERGRMKILDFGLARAPGGPTDLTGPGTVVGTPGYMAPEQARGEPVDARCDLFSLGCVLYQACTGLPPFRGANTAATLLAVDEKQPPPPAALTQEVPAALSDLVMRLLAKDPADRPASARAVGEVLEDIEAVHNRRR